MAGRMLHDLRRNGTEPDESQCAEYQALYGLTDEQVRMLQGEVSGGSSSGSSGGSGGGSGGKGYDNGNYATADVKKAQAFLGVDSDGKWGPKSQAAAKAKGYNSLAEVIAAMNKGTGDEPMTDEEVAAGIKFMANNRK